MINVFVSSAAFQPFSIHSLNNFLLLKETRLSDVLARFHGMKC